MMKGSVVALLVVATVAVCSVEGVTTMGVKREYVGDTPAQRAHAVLVQMNITEKIAMLHGATGPYVGNIVGNGRLNIPPILMNDGPQGFRDDAHPGTTTAWPSGMTVGTSWDVDAAQAWGKAMGEEFVAKGANVQLGPGMCLARVPECGRNFEYVSGEDPYLGNALVKPIIAGIQGTGVIANAKHFVNNNEETNRHTISEIVDERTEFEMYLSPFQGAVDAGVMSIMCSYNKINGTWSCENSETLGWLKGKMGFNGWVMSDWFATHSTIESAMAGLDQEMPNSVYFGSALEDAVTSGKVPLSNIDDKVMRILTAMFAAGLFDHGMTGSITANVTSVAHNQLARKLSGEATVLLKNDGDILPLSTSKTPKVAVIGNACQTNPIVTGNGSGNVPTPYIITVLQGITNRAGAGATVTYTQTSVDEAVAAAKAADVAILCTATVSGEGADRVNLSLPLAEDNMISAVAAVQKNSVVVVSNPGAVLMPWSDDVAAIVMQSMPGQEAGNAAADVLYGLVNPSARLTLTMPNKENEVGFTQAQYPGLPANNPATAVYSERLLIGYRWYAAHGVTPKFAFGHGLSYTTFTYSNLVVKTNPSEGLVAMVTVDIENSGSVDGADVPQLYLNFPKEAGEPPIQLKGFSKVYLNAGASATVQFALNSRDVSIWDVSTHDWAAQSGEFGVYIGKSSYDLVLKGSFTL